MKNEGITTKEEALIMVDANNITNLLHPQFVAKQEKKIFTKTLSFRAKILCKTSLSWIAVSLLNNNPLGTF